MTIERSEYELDASSRLLDTLWQTGDKNTYHILRMIDNYINQYGPGWGIRSKIELSSAITSGAFGYFLGSYQAYLPGYVTSYMADFSQVAILQALQSHAGKAYLHANRDAIAQIILHEGDNIQSGTGLTGILRCFAQYIKPPKSYIEKSAERYLYLRQYRGLETSEADFIEHMKKIDVTMGPMLTIANWCETFPGARGINQKEYQEVVANAIHLSIFQTDYFIDSMHEVQAKYVSQAVNAYLNRNGYYQVKNMTVQRLIASLDIYEISNVGMALGDDKKYHDMYSRLTTKQESVWTLEALLDLVYSLLPLEAEKAEKLVQYGITLVKASQYKGVPSGLAFDIKTPWPGHDDNHYWRNFREGSSVTTIIDEVGDTIPDILPFIVDVDKTQMMAVINAIKDTRVDKMRLLYGSIISLLQSNPNLAKTLGTKPHVERLSKMILGLTHASLITNNFGPDRLEMLGYKINGMPLLQCLNPLLTEILSTALQSNDPALYSHIETLLTSLYVDQAEGSFITNLLQEGFTRQSIYSILSTLPDDNATLSTDIVTKYIDQVISMRADLSQDDATSLAQRILPVFQNQKQFQQYKVFDIYTSIEQILDHKNIQQIGPEIGALHKIMQAINHPKSLSDPIKWVELRDAIKHLDTERLPLQAFIRENRANLQIQLASQIGKGNVFTQYILCPLLCIIDLDLATALRTGKVNNATRLHSLLLAIPAVPVAGIRYLMNFIGKQLERLVNYVVSFFSHNNPSRGPTGYPPVSSGEVPPPSREVDAETNRESVPESPNSGITRGP
jgi:hypothetical protein